jgi:hypothetical protein
MEVLGATVKMTVFRKLKILSYRASYSHAGKYYTLDEIAKYDEYDLWNFNRIHFSRNGSLINTIEHLINSSEDGYFASELKEILKVRVQEPLLKLYSLERVYRQQIGSAYLYLSTNRWSEQFEKRKRLIEMREVERGPYSVLGFESAEARSCLPFFLSTLNENQRRLYIGFESMKLGRGGDTAISRITGINVATIARGRRELLSHDITPERIRKEGGGRHCVKKNGSAEGIGTSNGR